MRMIGTQAHGIRLPIISRGDNLAEIVVDAVTQAVSQEELRLKSTDVVAVTEAIVAKAQGNFASIDDIGTDIRSKFPGGTVGVIFPICSRNRFLNILKGVVRGADKVYVLLQYPTDEVGNPIMDVEMLDDLEDKLKDGPIPAARFREIVSGFVHPFTGVDYLSLYGDLGDNVEVYVSNDPRDILKLTKHVLVAEIHSRFRTKKRLEKAGALSAFTLSDVLSAPINGSGFNAAYGVLGSNLATDETLKLFPNNCEEFVAELRAELKARTGVTLEVMIYGDGAFKDPVCGIWELADPVVSPACTPFLKGRPDEIKIKYVAENVFMNMSNEEKRAGITEMIRTKETSGVHYNEGTTPRPFSDLLGSLCDLVSGSGDKGTPVILIQGYFDNYAVE